ncbi:13459_t:CDS:2, partial [Entrophospora sp. SA101]
MKAAKVNELEEEVEALKVELEKSDDRIEELEERVDIEVEMNLKALDKSAEWREKQLKEQIIKKYKDRELPALPKKQKQSRLLKFKKLVNKVKEKSKKKFQTHVLEKFEAHILQPNDQTNLDFSTAPAAYQMVAHTKSEQYFDISFICKDCKLEYDNNVLPRCEKCD